MRLALILSHPIQYYSPWFRFLNANGFDSLRVFYLWNGGVTEKLDPGFGVSVKWDVPLLDGYDYEFVPNRAKEPGTHSVCGLNNQGLAKRISAFAPDALLIFGYNYLTHYRFLLSRIAKSVPLLFRGDSHRLAQRVPLLGERGGEFFSVSASEGKSQGEAALISQPKARLMEVLRRKWIATVLRRFSAFLYVGQANREYFQHHRVADEELFFCPHCVDNERFFGESAQAAEEAAVWKRKLGIDPRRKIVLYAGKFEPKKRPLDLVAAFKDAKLSDTTLVLVGNGRLESALHREAADRPDIVVAPFQNQTLMPRTYMLGDIFVLPSYGSGETWGLAVNEAMCMGRPIIVSNHVGCAWDLVHPNRNGLVFPAGDIEALAASLREACSDPARLRAWGDQSRKIIQDYDYVHATRGLHSALEFVLSKNR